MLERLYNDLRIAIRCLAQRPGFTLAAVGILALGIGATSAVFSVAHGVLLRPLPYQDPGRLVRISPETPINKRLLVALRERVPAFEQQVSGFGTWSMPLTEGGDPEVISVGRVSEGHFATLGAQALLGRAFEGSDHQPGGSQVAILSYGLWQRRFGGEQDVLERRLEINGREHAVIGVMPRGHRPLETGWQLWTPLVVDPNLTNDLDSSYYLGAIGRLGSSISIEQAQAQVQSVAWELVDEHAERFTRDRAEQAKVVGLHEHTVGAVQPTLLLLLAAVAVILLVACANIAHLLLSRAAGRQREMAIRAALGADRRRLLRQVAVESLALATLGGLAGLLLALWTFDILQTQLPPDMPRGPEIAFDGPVLVFGLVATMVSALLFGLAPAFRLAYGDLRSSLTGSAGRNGSSRSGSSANSPGKSGASQKLASILVIAQVAAAAALLSSALLLVQSLKRLRAVDPGFDSEHVLSLRPVLSPSRYSSAQAVKFYEQAFESLAALPGTVDVGAIQLLPMGGGNWNFPFRVEGQALPTGQKPGTSLPTANFRVVTPGYFESLSVPILEGRAFEDRDRADAQPIGLVNQTLARQLWPGQEAVGRQLYLFGDEQRPFTVVGVVGDVRQHDLAEAAQPELYWPLAQSGEFGVRSMAILVRTQGQPNELAPAARETLRALDPNIPITDITSLPEVLDAQVAEPRLIARVMSSFALLAMILSMVGVYAVVSASVTTRVREIGIRMALGAARATVVQEVLRDGLKRVGVGLAIGLAAATGLGRVLRHHYFGVEVNNPAISALALSAVLLAALLALWLPARRASSVDPTIALRHE